MYRIVALFTLVLGQFTYPPVSVARPTDSFANHATTPLAAAVTDPGSGTSRSEKIAILRDHLPNVDDALVQSLIERLRRDRFQVTELSAAQVCDTNVLKAEDYFLYVIPQCQNYPVAGLAALQAFASGGGHLLFLGGPLLDEPLWHGKSGWLNRQAILDIKRNVAAGTSSVSRGVTHHPRLASNLQ